jgi:hypothetical protein
MSSIRFRRTRIAAALSAALLLVPAAAAAHGVARFLQSLHCS